MRNAVIHSIATTLIALSQFACRDIPTQPTLPLRPLGSPVRAGIRPNVIQVDGISIVDLGFGVGNAINEAGSIVGYGGAFPSTVAEIWYSDGSSHGFLVNCPPACGVTPFPGCDPLGVPGCQPGSGAPSAAFGLNNTGKVVGYYSYDERFISGWDDAFIWTEGAQYVASPFLHHHGTRLYAINDAGQSVGSYRFDGPGSSQTHALLFDANGTLHDLGAPVGTRSVAYDLNANGDAVGQSPGPDDFVSGEAILWPRGAAPIRLGLIGGNTISAARAINDAGVVVGWMRGSLFNKVPFRWSADRGLESLPTLGNGGVADGINNEGYIVGTVALQPNSSAGHAALWTPDGELIDLGTLAGGRSEATDINSRLQVSGDATDANGQSHVVRWDVSLANHAPIVDAHGPYVGLEGSPVMLNGSATDQDNDITSVEWQFGDGGTGVGAMSTHTYLDNGTYSASLTATDSHGLTASSPATVIIANVPPTLHVTAVSSLSSGEMFDLTTTFSDPGIRDMPWTYRIDWGSGAPTTGSTNAQDAPIVSTSPRYCAAGNYTVRTTVTDKDNGTGAATISVEVDRIGVPFDVLPETLNPRAEGELPVAVLSTSTIDAREVDVATVTLGDGQENAVAVARHPNNSFSASIEDVNHDGRPDLLLHFKKQALAALGILNPPSTRLWLLARLVDGCREIAGNSEVRVLSKSP